MSPGALGESIFAEAESWPALESERFADAGWNATTTSGERPGGVVRLHFVRDQVLGHLSAARPFPFPFHPLPLPTQRAASARSFR